MASLYFSWLQKDNPVGKPDGLPLLHNGFETSIPGILCIGDLTGIPLIKLASESGRAAVEQLRKNDSFMQEKAGNADPEILDVLIAGAGPSGISAALRCQELGLRHVVIESARMFSTIRNFPEKKPIYVTPADTEFLSMLRFTDGTKESLLTQLEGTAASYVRHVHENETVQSVKRHGAVFLVQTDKASYSAVRVIIATGRTGNARTLSVHGAGLPKVFSRLIDPYAYSNKNILVIGGGNSAVETAVSLALAGNPVTLSYRRNELFRVTKRNVDAFEIQVRKGTILPAYNSTVKRIDDKTVTLATLGGDKTIPNDVVYAMIGSEIPVNFLRRIGIKILGPKNPLDYCALAFSLLFASMIYFGKSVPHAEINSLLQFFRGQMHVINFQNVISMETGGAWMGFLGTMVLGPLMVLLLLRLRKRLLSRAWDVFKYSYFCLCVALFVFVYISYNLSNTLPLGFHPGCWYSFMFSATVIIFGMRRIYVHPTGYIFRQTAVLALAQTVFLFVLPLFLLPWLGSHGYLNGWIMHHVFPDQSYWRSYGFILAWPLLINNLASATGHIPAFWLILSIVQTFIIIPAIVLLWGKGAYCGWICSCGALAETLGDEHRAKALHGLLAKRGDNAGQIILWFAFAVTLASVISSCFPFINHCAAFLVKTYSLSVDTLLAGIVGLGCYFFLSGRVWCRFFCPLAALMHIYNRFSRFRIMANKNRCISCTVCTTVCHMGIDVMNYANKGIPMNDVQCVRCSACVVNCPLQVLTFGKTRILDVENQAYKTLSRRLTCGWKSGLPESKMRMLLKEQDAKTAPVNVSQG